MQSPFLSQGVKSYKGKPSVSYVLPLKLGGQHGPTPFGIKAFHTLGGGAARRVNVDLHINRQCDYRHTGKEKEKKTKNRSPSPHIIILRQQPSQIT